jgi:hypothetical protein
LLLSAAMCLVSAWCAELLVLAERKAALGADQAK